MKVYLRTTLLLLLIIFTGTFSIQNSYASAIQLPQTGQTNCYDSVGTEVACSGTGQDGELREGVAWPATRFVNLNGTTPVNANSVFDKLTGLEWARDAGTPTVEACVGGLKTWQAAIDYVKCINELPGGYLGHSDWRLPNVNELRSLTNAQTVDGSDWLESEGYNEVQSYYWSSSNYASDVYGAWLLTMKGGFVGFGNKASAYNVWPVRDGVSGVTLPQTGQTRCYDSACAEMSCAGTGQDGELRAGVAWPVPRFANPDNTTPVTGDVVFDTLTGLEWVRNAGTPTVGSCTGGTRSWKGALDYVKCLNTLPGGYLGHADWRLPNVSELRSLANDQEVDNSSWLNGQGCSNVQSNIYWSSSTPAFAPAAAWLVHMLNGVVGGDAKIRSYYVWPVRGGQSGELSPTLSPITDQITEADAVKLIDVSIYDPDTPAFRLTVTATSSNQTLVPDANLALGGIDGGRILTIAPATGQTGTTTITVSVNDGTSTATRSFLLTVKAPEILTVEISGCGRIDSITPDIPFICNSVSCTEGFITGTELILRATPGSISGGVTLFSGWTGDCAGTGDCSLTISGPRSVTANFTGSPNARLVGGGDYASLSEAYGAVDSSGTIESRAQDFMESLFLDRGIAVTFKGGYDACYHSNSGWTTLNGTLTVSSGSLTVNELIIR